ncbi:MAG TPA: acetate kinase [Candidatus Mailhella merdigallinarum]|uniref:Acetate kinase n=1 Tax=Candidatus Mailhella merdigallinarum TaxID=2838658 RepID=A0A9D2HE40_9BACT|nr:acetate kinase [Desulfovibrionaceae bacterium]HJA08501.1 acetate kinase [Candidatus Mailhella merdigallinarum]
MTEDTRHGRKVLVINGGSSSFKYQILDMSDERRLCYGVVERIGSPDGVLTHKRLPGTDREETFVYHGDYYNHTAGMRAVAAVLLDPERGGVISSADDLAAVGHRVLMAGPEYAEALVDDVVKEVIRDYSPLGPLHNPANLAGIEVMEEIFPGLPNVAVFDTGFHTTMPDYAYTYAIPRRMAAKYRIRRYGFHGTSHRYVSREAAKLVGRPVEQLNLISCHLGNGCSVCAIRQGRSVDTSMGLTPLEGLIMGTRSGSIDPAILTYLMLFDHYSGADLNTLLNEQSGLRGLCGRSDMRDLLAARDAGDENAALALTMFVYSLRKYIGSYFPVLGRVDGLIFTGGIGENAPEVRARTCADMEVLGIRLDEALNVERSHQARVISPVDAPITVFVIPTDEELEIARATLRVLDESPFLSPEENHV